MYLLLSDNECILFLFLPPLLHPPPSPPPPPYTNNHAMHATTAMMLTAKWIDLDIAYWWGFERAWLVVFCHDEQYG